MSPAVRPTVGAPVHRNEGKRHEQDARFAGWIGRRRRRSGRCRRNPEGCCRAAWILEQHLRRRRPQAGVLQGGWSRHRDSLYRRGRLHAYTGDCRQHRHRHDQRHARRHRRLRQGHAGAHHQRGSDRRSRRFLVCASGERHQEPCRHQRQDHRVFLARLVDQPHSAAAGEPGEGELRKSSPPAARRPPSRR